MKRVTSFAAVAGLVPLAFGPGVLPTAAGTAQATSATSGARTKTVSGIHLVPNTACIATSYVNQDRSFSSNMEFYYTSHYGGNANKVCIGTVYYQEFDNVTTGLDMRLRIRSKGNAILYSTHVGGTLHQSAPHRSVTFGVQVRQVFSRPPIEVCAATVFGPHWSNIADGPTCEFVN